MPNEADQFRLMLIQSDRYWLIQIYADWCWLMLIDANWYADWYAEWFWLILINAQTRFNQVFLLERTSGASPVFFSCCRSSLHFDVPAGIMNYDPPSNTATPIFIFTQPNTTASKQALLNNYNIINATHTTHTTYTTYATHAKKEQIRKIKKNCARV